MYWLQLVDKYAANWSVLLIAITECILVAWVYGADRFLDDIQSMIGARGRTWRFFWTWMWKIVTPATLLFILFFNWVEYEPLKYGEYIYPWWADHLGWIIGMLPVSVIIVMGIVSEDTSQNFKILSRWSKVTPRILFFSTNCAQDENDKITKTTTTTTGKIT